MAQVLFSTWNTYSEIRRGRIHTPSFPPSPLCKWVKWSSKFHLTRLFTGFRLFAVSCFKTWRPQINCNSILLLKKCFYYHENLRLGHQFRVRAYNRSLSWWIWLKYLILITDYFWLWIDPDLLWFLFFSRKLYLVLSKFY